MRVGYGSKIEGGAPATIISGVTALSIQEPIRSLFQRPLLLRSNQLLSSLNFSNRPLAESGLGESAAGADPLKCTYLGEHAPHQGRRVRLSSKYRPGSTGLSFI